MTVCCTNPYSRLKAAPSFIEVIWSDTGKNQQRQQKKVLHNLHVSFSYLFHFGYWSKNGIRI